MITDAIETEDNNFFKVEVSTGLWLPYLSAEVPAGFPSPADDFLEDPMDFNRQFIKNPSSSFWKRVRGHSMVDIGIFPGSWLLVDRSIRPKTRHIAICWLDGRFTVKELKIEQDIIWLVARNDEYEPIKVTKDNEFVVWGIVRVIVNELPV